MSDIIQGTAEWHNLRLGKVTASRVADLTAKTKTGWGASRHNYTAELLAERLTGVPAESYKSVPMLHGIETEPEARLAYEFRGMIEVEQIGFIHHPTIEMSGASPDGLVGADGMVEIKCPNTATHIETLLVGRIPEKYVTQMLWQLACTGRKWCDFVSFDPRLPERMRLFVARVQRDEKRIKELEAAVTEFLFELDNKIAGLTRLYGGETMEAAE